MVVQADVRYGMIIRRGDAPGVALECREQALQVGFIVARIAHGCLAQVVAQQLIIGAGLLAGRRGAGKNGIQAQRRQRQEMVCPRRLVKAQAIENGNHLLGRRVHLLVGALAGAQFIRQGDQLRQALIVCRQSAGVVVVRAHQRRAAVAADHMVTGKVGGPGSMNRLPAVLKTFWRFPGLYLRALLDFAHVVQQAG